MGSIDGFELADDNDIKLLNAVASLHILHGNPTHAKELLQLSYALDNECKQTVRLLTIVHMRLGNYGLASEFMRTLGQIRQPTPAEAVLSKLAAYAMKKIAGKVTLKPV